MKFLFGFLFLLAFDGIVESTPTLWFKKKLLDKKKLLGKKKAIFRPTPAPAPAPIPVTSTVVPNFFVFLQNGDGIFTCLITRLNAGLQFRIGGSGIPDGTYDITINSGNCDNPGSPLPNNAGNISGRLSAQISVVNGNVVPFTVIDSVLSVNFPTVGRSIMITGGQSFSVCGDILPFSLFPSISSGCAPPVDDSPLGYKKKR